MFPCIFRKAAEKLMEDADGVLRNLTLASKLQESTRVAIDNANKNIQEAIDLHDKVSAWCLVQYLQRSITPISPMGWQTFQGIALTKPTALHTKPLTLPKLSDLFHPF